MFTLRLKYKIVSKQVKLAGYKLPYLAESKRSPSSINYEFICPFFEPPKKSQTKSSYEMTIYVQGRKITDIYPPIVQYGASIRLPLKKNPRVYPQHPPAASAAWAAPHGPQPRFFLRFPLTARWMTQPFAAIALSRAKRWKMLAAKLRHKTQQIENEQLEIVGYSWMSMRISMHMAHLGTFPTNGT